MSVLMMWFVAALVLAGLEMLSGTLYLLAIACGLAIGGVAAASGVAIAAQIILASLSALIAVGALHQWRAYRARSRSAHPAYVNPDIGQKVTIDSWTDAVHARVRYRGTLWDAEVAPGSSSPEARIWFIVAQRGNLLLIDLLPPHPAL